MNRTDRLYALVEELRATAPRARSARRLAERFDGDSVAPDGDTLLSGFRKRTCQARRHG